MTSGFSLVTDCPAGPEKLFDISRDIGEHVASMSDSGEQAIAGVRSATIGLGETVTWRARHFGVWFTMTSKITELDRPHRFVDEQVKGPFRRFHHLHEFLPLPGGGCRMIDTITLASPVFGFAAERLILVPHLRRLIGKRNQHLLSVLATHP